MAGSGGPWGGGGGPGGDDRNKGGGEDDDGAAAGAPPKVGAEQLQTLRDRLAACGKDEKRFVAYLKLDALEDLTVSRFASALAFLGAGRVAS